MLVTESIYQTLDCGDIPSPSLLLFEPVLDANLRQLIKIVGDVSRLRPHCKTHKSSRVIGKELELGISKHKAATFREAEMLAEHGVRDLLLAYNIVGPNIERAVAFRARFPDVSFAVTADHSGPISQLNEAMMAAGTSIGVMLDIDTGQHRTGVPPDDRAIALYRSIEAAGGLEATGFHVYDGQNHQTDLGERQLAAATVWRSVEQLRDDLAHHGHDVPRVVAGGTGTFPCYAAIDDPSLELSPGTNILHDAGYSALFPDLDFHPAALLLTRVVSRPGHELLTCDLGYKAVASDPPLERRVVFPDLPDASLILQNEEHLVVGTSSADEYCPGDVLFAIPYHICPTSALHHHFTVIRDGGVVEHWPVDARDR